VRKTISFFFVFFLFGDSAFLDHRAFFRVVCKSKGATRHHHHHPALSLSLLISLSNRDVCALGADIETLSLSLQRNGRTRTKKKGTTTMAKYYPDIAKGAKGTTDSFFRSSARAEIDWI